MGSFNIQCVASKMNITHHDEVVVFPLFKTKKNKSFKLVLDIEKEMAAMPTKRQEYLKNYGGEMFASPSKPLEMNLALQEAANLYPCEEWELGLPIMASYNDYGGFELKDKHQGQLAAQVFINYIKLNAVEVSKENYQYCRIHFDPKNLKGDKPSQNEDIEKIIQVQQESLLLVSGDGFFADKFHAENYHQVTFSYMDKKIYEHILDEMKNDRNEIHQKIDEHIALIPGFVKAQREYFDLEKDSPDRMEKMSAMRELEQHIKIRGVNTSYREELKLFYPDHYFDYQNYMTENSETKELFWQESKKEVYIKALKLKADTYLVNQFMAHELHEAWTPVKYSGQENSNSARIKFNQISNKIAKEKYKEHFGEDMPRKKMKKG